MKRTIKTLVITLMLLNWLFISTGFLKALDLSDITGVDDDTILIKSDVDEAALLNKQIINMVQMSFYDNMVAVEGDSALVNADDKRAKIITVKTNKIAQWSGKKEVSSFNTVFVPGISAHLLNNVSLDEMNINSLRIYETQITFYDCKNKMVYPVDPFLTVIKNGDPPKKSFYEQIERSINALNPFVLASQGKVVNVTGSCVTINVGEEQGLQLGDTLTVFNILKTYYDVNLKETMSVLSPTSVVLKVDLLEKQFSSTHVLHGNVSNIPPGALLAQIK